MSEPTGDWPPDVRERLAALEVEVRHLTAKVEDTNAKLDDTNAKVSAMHDLVMQARGARWLLAGLVGIGGFGAGLAAKLLPVVSAAPKP